MGEIQQPTFTPKEYMQKPKRGEEQLAGEKPYSASMISGAKKEGPEPVRVVIAPEMKKSAAAEIRAKYESTPIDQLKGYAEVLQSDIDALLLASAGSAEAGDMDQAMSQSEQANAKQLEMETIHEMIGEQEVAEAEAEAKEAANG